ncbi:MAG: hypothetical protein ACK6AY_14250 [Akkermansiaceae bacterium]
MNRASTSPPRNVLLTILCCCIALIYPAHAQHLDPSQVLVI